MAKIEQIRWGAYSSFEGPFYVSGPKYQMPVQPKADDHILATITATEGGSWSAVNMYDVCRLTLGLIQCCEGSQFWSSELLGRLLPEDLAPLRALLSSVGVRIGQAAPGKWRFIHDTNGAVDTEPEQCRLFFAGCSGRKGEWNAAAKLWAKQFCLAAANCLESPASQEAQRFFIVPKLRAFAAGELKNYVFKAPDTEIGQAFVCAALSFAANNPLRAKQAFQAHLDSTKAKPWTLDWLVGSLEMFTFLSGITIYPHRYNAIRPVLERLFNIDLPDKSDQLGGLLTTSEIQQILVHVLGYDLGPGGPNGDGVDNKWGAKSKAALLDFERRRGLKVVDGMPDMIANDELRRVRDDFQNKATVEPIPNSDLSQLLANSVLQRFDEIGIIREQALAELSPDEGTDPATPKSKTQPVRS